jgi:hypothetical protein
MSTAESDVARAKRVMIIREWASHYLGISDERKRTVYIDISRAATLLDVGYWLQIVFAAGIATLGLVLNSPAVIIGAMLISPLMGPILSAGLSLAAGDLVLAIRSAANLILSCFLSVGTAAFLVWLLPFKDVTGGAGSVHTRAGRAAETVAGISSTSVDRDPNCVRRPSGANERAAEGSDNSADARGASESIACFP